MAFVLSSYHVAVHYSHEGGHVPDNNGATAQAKLVMLYPAQVEAVATYAQREHDANFSAGLRAMIRHFTVCQFPLLGLPESDDTPEAEA
jgi:hypothetical protein